MTINKKYFYNSLKKDYNEMSIYAAIFIFGAIFLFAGIFYTDTIVNLLSYVFTGIRASYIYAVIEIVFTGLVLLEIANPKKDAPNKDPSLDNSVTNVGILFVVGIITGIVFWLAYVCYLAGINITSPLTANPRIGAFIVECIVALVVLTLIQMIAVPIAFAYARSKDIPEDKQ